MPRTDNASYFLITDHFKVRRSYPLEAATLREAIAEAGDMIVGQWIEHRDGRAVANRNGRL